MKIIDWVNKYQLTVKKVKDKIFNIEEVGTFYYFQPEDNVFDNEMFFTLTEDQIEYIITNEVKYVLFQFGERFYYTPAATQKNILNEQAIKVDFNDFTYLGVYKDSYDFPYTHLGIHTEYELLNSALNVKTLLKKAKFYQQNTVGICDRNTLGGTLAFQLECKSKGVKSILGETVNVKYGENKFGDIKLYAANKQGWQNLLRINYFINVTNYKDQYIDEKHLLNHSKGLIAVIPSYNSVLTKERSQIEYWRIIQLYTEAFHQTYFQLNSTEYTDNKHDLENLNSIKFYLNSGFVTQLPPVLLEDVYYLEPDHYKIKDLVNKVARTIHHHTEDSYYKPLEVSIDTLMPFFDLEKQYSKVDAMDIIVGAVANTNKIAEDCNYEIEVGKSKLPSFEIDGQILTKEESNSLLVSLVWDGYKEKVVNKLPKDKHKIYKQRVETELEVILEAGFADYFLITWDSIDFCRQNDQMTGIARGSAGGSICMFLLGIIQIDPILYDLSFERFLNKARVVPEKIIEVTMSNGETKVYKEYDKIVTLNRGEINAGDLTEQDEL
jgi:DNA polymerase-3 subunit alpha